MKITDEMREAAATAVAIEINGADGAWDSPRFLRIADAVLEAVASMMARAEARECAKIAIDLGSPPAGVMMGSPNPQAAHASLSLSIGSKIAQAIHARHATPTDSIPQEK